MRISLILIVTIAVMAMAVQADKPPRPPKAPPAAVVKKVDNKYKKTTVAKKRPVVAERNFNNRPKTSARVAKKVKNPLPLPVRQARLIKPQVALKKPVPVQRRKKVQKVQQRQQVQQRRPQQQQQQKKVSNFARFLKHFSKQVNRPSLRFSNNPVVDNRRRFNAIGKVHPLVNAKAEDIKGYEKFTLDEVVYPGKLADEAQERSDNDITVVIEEIEASEKKPEPAEKTLSER